jgi:23S rRNA pseudouridine1911/1915/1917 synthase
MTRNRGYAYRSQIGPAAAGRRVREHLAASYGHSDQTVWDARLDAGEIELDGRPAGGDETLRPGQHLVWHRPPWNEPDVPLAFDLLHEDAALIAVAKPSGLPTMPAGGFLAHTLLALVRARFGEVHPAHRLGRFTSGLVVFARTRESAATLAHAWRSHTVVKSYRALVTGDPTWASLAVDTPIGPVAHDVLGEVHAASASGRVAHSVATVIERRGASALCDVIITTGRPHQIRIHMAAVGHPLAGDPLYANGGLPLPDSRALPGDGGYLLHAHRLQVAHPSDSTPLLLEAPPPVELQTAAERTHG